MKKFALILTALSIAYVFSAPTYYTFTGKIAFIPVDQGGYAAAHGIHAGSPVTYIFVVDTAQNAYTKFRGTKEIKPDTINVGTGYHADYFFDSLITPSLFSPAVTDSSSGSYLGYRTITTNGTQTRYSLAFQTTIGNVDHGTQIIFGLPDSGSGDYLPKVGATAMVTESYVDSSVASSGASMTLTLTNISTTKPSGGVRSFGPTAKAWTSAELHAGALIIENHSGKKAMAKILDASGKTIVNVSMGDKATIPASSLPRGKLFLEVTAPGQGEPVRQALFH